MCGNEISISFLFFHSISFSSFIQAAGEAVGLVASSSSSLGAALVGVRAKDVAVPGTELISIAANAKVSELVALLKRNEIHSVPVWNGHRLEKR